MMADNLSYEDMIAELKANGYQFGAGLTTTYVHLPDGASFSDTDGNAVTAYAWQHYQQQKRYTAMEALLKNIATIPYNKPVQIVGNKLVARDDDGEGFYTVDEKLKDIVNEAKTILGEGE